MTASAHAHHHHPTALLPLAVGALGVVYGDIGTSPLYTLRECVRAVGGESFSRDDLYGLLSLIFWSLTMVVTVKYLTFVMRANNKGEGGIFALLALLPPSTREPVTGSKKRLGGIALLVVVGAALLYGDGAITPAISVLSAMEGLTLVEPHFEHLIVPLTVVILVGLFAMQRFGTGAVGALFGPVMIAWFLTIGGLGVFHIAREPQILWALSPTWAVAFFAHHGTHGVLVLGSVVLAVTGGEALYADMGHFGVKPIRFAWLGVVMPALLLCYFGQGALLLHEPHAIANPFFSMVPKGPFTVALVVLSSAATVIASQALISGAFSLTRQAMQLGYFPRVTVTHTARQTEGQIYIPEINWLLAAGCIALVLSFRRSEHLASAYGIAVTGTMAITSIAYFAVVRETWKWSLAKALPVLVLFLAFDLPFFFANVFKILDGGWVPVMIGIGFVAAMLVWNRGRTLVVEQYAKRFPEYGSVPGSIIRGISMRTPGTAVFLSSSGRHVPPVLMHYVERQQTVPEKVVLLTVHTEHEPTVEAKERFALHDLGEGFYRLTVRYGFMEHPDVPAALRHAVDELGLPVKPREVTYYLGRERFLATEKGRMGAVAETIFAWLSRNSAAADQHFKIPPRQVMELGVQLDL